MAQVIAPFAGYQARALSNLTYIYPQITQANARRLAQNAANNTGRQLAELVSTSSFTRIAQNARLCGPGVQAMRAAQASDQPVIFITGHLGNFNAARISVLAEGFNLGVLYRPMHNSTFNHRYKCAMERLSLPMFSQTRAGMKQMVRHLQNGNSLAIVADMRAGDGVVMDFMDYPAKTGLTAATLAWKYNAHLIPIWGLRKADGINFDIIVETPIPHTDPITMMQDFNHRLSDQVTAYPDQWFWFHRRWKQT